MSFVDLASARFSVRKFDGRPVPAKVLDQILQTARIAPTAANNQPQRIYVLQSDEALEKIDKLCRCIYGAHTVLLIAYDEDEQWTNPFEPGVASGEQDASIAATHAMMRAQELGIGSCWVNLFANRAVEEAFGLPASERSVLLMPLGYPADDAKPSPKWHATKKPLEQIVRYL